MSASYVSGVLLAGVFTGVRTPAVKALGVLEVHFGYRAAEPADIHLAVPALKREWTVARSVLADGLFLVAERDGVQVAPGPRRARILLPSPGGRVALYASREQLLNLLSDTVAVAPLPSAGEQAEAGWL